MTKSRFELRTMENHVLGSPSTARERVMILPEGTLDFASAVEGAGLRCQDRVKAICSADECIFAVMDGAGGTSLGEEAAEFVADALIHCIDRDLNWSEWLRFIDQRLDSNAGCGETTAVVVRVRDGILTGASVGDSGAWLLLPDRIVDLTNRQVRKPLLGSSKAVPTSFGPINFAGRLVLGSDGLFNYANADRIRAIATNLPIDSAVTALLNSVRLPSGHLRDDIGVIVAG